ncbi:hypothetical protein EAM_2593 [Erwinia amylovora ATCC 49946]|nr:hypothetical protein EAM_2593 [Erwinia amylovora ATCC 49946]
MLQTLQRLFFAVMIAGAPMPQWLTPARHPQTKADFFFGYFFALRACARGPVSRWCKINLMT